MTFKPSRTTGIWKPDRITCKRFGVSFIKPDEDEPDADEIYEKLPVNLETMKKLMDERDRIFDEDGSQGDVDVNVDDVNVLEIIAENIERPSMDLFKAIFCDSEDEEEDIKKESDGDLGIKDGRFRPVFSKPTIKPTTKIQSITNGNPNEKRKSLVKLQCLEDFEEEDEFVVPKKRMRPSAADYM